VTGPGSALARRDRLWPAVAVSLAAHAALVAALVVRAGPVLDLDQKPIVAKLVRLGETRPKEYLPRKDEPPPPPPPATAAAPTPAPSAPTPPAAPSRSATAPAPKPAAARSAPGGAPGGTSLSNVLSRVRKQVEETRYGDPQGDPTGDASEGEEGDRYLALVHQAIHQNYRAPSTISERERLYLKATVVLYVEADGRIARWTFQARSGNAAFDAAVENAIVKTRVPPPPPELRATYRSSGIGVNFTAT
jgi:colicin import membrane protein/protein TonB